VYGGEALAFLDSGSKPQWIKPLVSYRRTYQLAGLSPISDAIYISKKL
jgi:hypothetical protein